MATTINYRIPACLSFPIVVSIVPANVPDNIHYTQGDYSFTGLTPGNYELVFTDPYLCVTRIPIVMVSQTPTPTSPPPSRTSTVTPTATVTMTPSISATPPPTPTCFIDADIIDIIPIASRTPSPTPTVTMTPSLTSGIPPTPSPSPVPIYTACSTYSLGMVKTGGPFLSGNLLTSSATIGDYVIEWRLSSTSGTVELYTGLGSDPLIQRTHPFTDELVPQGTYYPVIKYVVLNGITYTPYINDVLLSGYSYSPDLLTCLTSIIISPLTCATTYGSDPAYPFTLSYRNATNISVNKNRTFSFELSSDTQKFAWEFVAYSVADQLKISYVDVSTSTTTLLDNFIVGQRSASGGNLNSDFSQVGYPSTPITYNYAPWTHGTPGVKYVSDLLGFTYGSGDYLEIEITGSVLEPSVTNTDWDVKLKCLSTTDIATYIPTSPDVTKFSTESLHIYNSGVTPTITYITGTTCLYNVTYNTDETFGSVKYQKGTSPYYIWKYTDFFVNYYYNVVGNYYLDNPSNISANWYTSCQLGWFWNGSIYNCMNLAAGQTATLSYPTANQARFKFTSVTDYNKMVSDITSIQATARYTTSMASSPTDPEYYALYYIHWIQGNSCGDTIYQNGLYIHLRNTPTLDGINYEVTFDLTSPSNGITGSTLCDATYNAIQSTISSMTYTRTIPIPLANRVSSVRSIDPIGGMYPIRSVINDAIVPSVLYYYSGGTFNGVGVYAYMYIKEAMINGLFDPAALGFVHDILAKEWRLYKMADRLTITNTSSHANRLTNWRLERKKYLRPSSGRSYPDDTMDSWDIVYEIP